MPSSFTQLNLSGGPGVATTSEEAVTVAHKTDQQGPQLLGVFYLCTFLFGASMALVPAPDTTGMGHRLRLDDMPLDRARARRNDAIAHSTPWRAPLRHLRL